ncbi:MAG: DUF4430 domain-containing protein, partial [Trebonia sp.]
MHIRARPPRTALVALAALAVCVACAGCGFGPGESGSRTKGVSVRVTRDFGAHPIRTVSSAKPPSSETVMRMLERSFKVTTRYGGGYVQSIGGHSGSGSHYDWFYYVNGIQAKQGAATTDVNNGDHIWWDLHDWQRTDSIPAVVELASR